jgi:hypothetical protein
LLVHTARPFSRRLFALIRHHHVPLL